ncbi:MAG: hypothetical protein JWP94_1067 [Mucilaginibacter sp.]|nr:hypothetical protein [Mucilaginibacter sp.]
MTNGIPLLQMNAWYAILASRLVVNVDKSNESVAITAEQVSEIVFKNPTRHAELVSAPLRTFTRVSLRFCMSQTLLSYIFPVGCRNKFGMTSAFNFRSPREATITFKCDFPAEQVLPRQTMLFVCGKPAYHFF